MKGIIYTTWIKIICIALGLIISIGYAQADDDKSIIIIKSSDNSYYNQSIETIIKLSSSELNFDVIDVRSNNIKDLSKNNNGLIIALGFPATRAVLELKPKQTSISAYITQSQIQHLPNMTSQHLPVLLDQPLERYLAFTQSLLKPGTIGLINQKPIKLSRKQKKLLSKLKLKLSQRQLIDQDKLLITIRSLKKESNAFLMLPDQVLFNRDTLKGVLLTTYRNRIPVISYSPAHVKSGALASIFSSPEDIGRHLADIVKRHQDARMTPGPAPEFARYFTIETNNRVAHALGLNLPDQSEIRNFLNEVSP